MPSRNLLILLTLSWSVVPVLFGQAQDPALRVESNLVLVDFVAGDKSGKPILDLTSKDLTISENGKLREIAFFQLLNYAQGGATLEPKSAPPPRTLSNPRDTPFLFVIDSNSLSGANLPEIRKGIRLFLESQQATRCRYMLATVGDRLQVYCSFTDDLEVLTEAMASVSVSKEPLRYGHLIERITYHFRAQIMSQAIEGALTEGKMFLSEMQQRITATSTSLAQLSDYISAIPGRKNLILFSEGYPLNSRQTVYDIIKAFNERSAGRQIVSDQILSAKLGGTGGDRGSKKLDDCMDQLNQARISVYGIDPRGTATQGLADSRDSSFIPTQLLTVRNSEDIVAPRRFLEKLADGTGGLTFFSLNDLAEGIRDIVTDSSSYYLAAFVPDESSRDKESIRLKLESTRPDISLRFRKNFSRTPDDPGVDGLLLAAFQFPSLFGDFPFDAATESEGGQFTVGITLPPTHLKFQEEDSKFRCKLTLYGVLLDQAGNWVTEGKKFSLAKEFQLRLDKAQLGSLLERETVTASAQATAPAGDYTLIVVVQQTPSQLVSARHLTITIH